jgi:hypothetical protein
MRASRARAREACTRTYTLYKSAASLSTNFESEDVRKHLERINSARDAFREADNNERIKRALKSRIQASNHEFYSLGDQVYFKEVKKNEWSGPAKVLGQDGKVFFFKIPMVLLLDNFFSTLGSAIQFSEKIDLAGNIDIF